MSWSIEEVLNLFLSNDRYILGFTLLFYVITHMIISQVLSYGHCVFSDWKCIVGIFIKKAPVYFERIWL